jgi:hypothetical protein
METYRAEPRKSNPGRIYDIKMEMDRPHIKAR